MVQSVPSSHNLFPFELHPIGDSACRSIVGAFVIYRKGVDHNRIESSNLDRSMINKVPITTTRITDFRQCCPGLGEA